jgi:hypothetical protein
MKLFGKNHIIICIITFGILFLMNYLGNDQADKLERALMIGQQALSVCQSVL